MEKFEVNIHGISFPIREIEIGDFFGDGSDYGVVRVADEQMWDEYEEEYDNGDSEICALDDSIFFFCESGYLSTDPTDEELLAYLKKHVC